MYLSGSAFLVSFADPNKQFFNKKFVFKFLNHGFSIYIEIYKEIYRYFTFLQIEILLSIKQCPLKLCLIINDAQQKLVQNCCLI